LQRRVCSPAGESTATMSRERSRSAWGRRIEEARSAHQRRACFPAGVPARADGVRVFLSTSGHHPRRAGGEARFLDRGIASIDAAYLEELTRYSRVLKQRNALPSRTFTAALDAWDEEFVNVGSSVQVKRAAYAREIADSLFSVIATHGITSATSSSHTSRAFPIRAIDAKSCARACRSPARSAMCWSFSSTPGRPRRSSRVGS